MDKVIALDVTLHRVTQVPTKMTPEHRALSTTSCGPKIKIHLKKKKKLEDVFTTM